MNPVSIINQAQAEGVTLRLLPTGTVKIGGAEHIVNRWRPVLKQHRAEIVNLLSGKPGGAVQATRPLPAWCRANCLGLEAIDLPNEGAVVGCVNPVTGAWRRLDWLQECPAIPTAKTAHKPGLPSWCKASCPCLKVSKLNSLASALTCTIETDAKHWAWHRIDRLTQCPKGEVKP